MNDTSRGKPLPTPSAESRPYWEGLQQHRLSLQRCASCKKPRHYPRPMCDACFSLEGEWFEASGKGTVHSWMVSHHAFHPGFAGDVPYVLITVDLDVGVRMVAPLVENDASQLTLGLAVELDYNDVSTAVTLPRFRIHE